MSDGSPMSSKVDVLFFGGWSISAEIGASFWAPFTRHHGSVCLIDLPVLSDSRTLDAWLCDQIPRVDAQTIISGWSLGGMLAVRLAKLLEERGIPYKALVCLMSPPKFVESSRYPEGMAHAQFSEFVSLSENETALLTRFPYLVSKGALAARQDLRFLRKCYPELLLDESVRRYGLSLLETFDVASDLADLNQRGLLVFGQHDALVGLAYSERLAIDYEMHSSVQLEALGHYPFGANSGLVLEKIRAFLGGDGEVLSDRAQCSNLEIG